MASNIILATPTENTSVDYKLPEGDSAKLSIASSDIVGLDIKNGELIMSLKDGGSIVIKNFQSFIDGGNTLSLADGIDVDPKLVAAGVGAGNDNALGEISDAIRIGVPAEGTTREISLEGGKKYLFDFDISQTQGANVENGTMTIAFSNGSKIVIPNYETAMAGEVPPELSLTSKTCVVTAEELITNIQNLAKSGVIEETTVVVVEEEAAPKPKSKLAAADLEGQDDIGPGGETAQQYAAAEPKPEDVEPAAGEEAELVPQQLESIEPAAGNTPGVSNRGGYGYNSSPGSDPFAGKQDIGPLGQTNLNYRAPEVEPIPAAFVPAAAPIVPPVFAHVVDETDMNGATTSVSGDIDIDFGSDLPNQTDPYRLTGSYDQSGSMTNNVLSSNGVPITISFTNGSAIGWAGNVKVFDLIMNTSTGEYTFTLYQQLDHQDGTDPNDGILLSFGMAGVDGDNDKVFATIQITVLDDAPIVGDDTNGVDETNLKNGPLVAQGNVTVDYGEDGQGTLATNGFTASGSMANNTLTSNGVAVVTTPNGNGWVGMAGNVKVFELTFDPATGNYTYTQYENLDHGDPDDANDIITLTFGLQIVDYDTDRDPGQIVILVRDDAPEFQNNGPQPDKGLETVDETNLSPTVVETGKLDANFGADTPGTYAFTTGGFTFSGSAANNALTSNGVPVVVTIVNGVYVGKAGNVEVFTLTLDPATGDYVFTLKDTLDHQNASDPDDIITLDFKVDATDFEGDTVVGSIRVNVKDDGPSITGAVENVDESNLVIVEQGDLTENFGKDGGGVISTIPGSFVASGSLDNGVSLTSNGQPVVVTSSATGYEGKVGNTVIFTLTINPTTGAYTYTQFKGLDHADNTNANDIITLTFGAKITDFDGDTAATNIVINIADDVPSFPPPPPPPGGGNPNPGDGYNIVDETDIVNSSLVVNGDLNANFGADVPGSYVFTTFGSTGSKLGGNLTSNGVPVTVAVENGVYVGRANGTEIFRLTLNTTTGEYQFTLKDTLDHNDPNDPNDVIRLTFGVNALDSEGEAAAGTIVIDVKDDVPVANDDVNAVDAGQSVGGDVNVNDKDGNDAPADITFVKFGNNQAVAIPADGSSVQIVGANGTLTINKHGVYTYQANANGNGVDNFTYTLRDYDGDTDPAVLSITVRDIDTIPEIIEPAPETVDETFLPGGITETGTVVADFKADGPGTFAMNGTFVSTGSKLNNALTHNGTPIVVTNTATGYEGKAGNLVVFSLTINPQTGGYVFRLFDNLDHANGGDPNDVITLKFGVTATDSDNDSVSTTITVNVLDDAPTITGSGGSVDETDLGPNPLVFQGDLTENFGQDGAGTISTTGVYTPSGSLDNGVSLTSGGQPVVVTSSATGYEGKVGNTVIFTLTINPTTGAYTYTQYKGLDHADNNNPNDVITLTFGTKITDWDGDTANANIVINVVDDVPSFPPPPPPPPGGQPKPGDGYNIVDETNLVPAGIVVTDTVVADFGADTPGSYGFRNSFDSSGSKTNGALTSNGVAVDVALVNGIWVGTAGGNEVFRLSINPATGQYTFTLKDTLDHADKNNPDDVIRLTFGIVARDSEGEGANGTIVIDVKDDAPTIVPGATLSVQEANLPTAAASSNLGIDFNNDGPGAVSTTGTYAAGGSLKNGVLSSSGVPVVISSTATGYVGKANGVDVFTLTINPSTGAYTFTLLKKLDHADDTNPNDIINLSFGVKITDYDGDTASTNILVNVVDDGPVILPPPVITKPDDSVDETNLKSGTITEGGTIIVNYQGAGPGTVGTTGGFTSGGSKLGGNLTSHGAAVNVTHSNGTYTGKTADGTTIFTLTVAATGEYTFRLFQELDHNNGSDPNDVITLNFGINATNSQGTSTNSTLTINVADDAPLAHRDDCTVFIHEGGYSSNVIAGDDTVGQDAPGVVSRVLGLSSVNIASSGTTTVQGQYGTLNIKADGSYTYTLKAGVAHGSVEVFTYTLKDFDGDTSTANLTISILANFNGTSATDVMHGSSGNDSMFGNGGVDYLYGEAGNDVMDGGTSADYMEGNEGNDTMYGGSGNDYLYGDGLNTSYVGHDTLYGGDGNDLFIGGRGNDTMTGGAGADQFWIMSMNGGLDTIKDFSIAEGDKIDLANVLTKYDPVTESINDFVFTTQSGGNTTVYVNANGTGGIGSATALIVLEGVNLTLNQLKNSIVTE